MRRSLFFPVAFLAPLIGLYAQNTATPSDLLKDTLTRPPRSLDSFTGMALNLNPTLKQADALVKRSAGQAKQAGLWPNPSVGYQGEQIRGGEYGGGEQGAFVQQTIVLGGKLGLRRNAYEQERKTSEIGVLEQRTRVLSEVSQRFYSALAAQKLIELRKQLLAVANDALETARQLQNVGQADAPDVLQSEVEAEQARLEFITAQRQYLAEFRMLAVAAGDPNLPVSLLAGDFENVPDTDAAQLADRIQNESPAVRGAQQNIARATAALKAAKRESVPDITVRAGMEQNYEHLNTDSNRAVGAQAFATLGITLPIFNRNAGNVTAAEADLQRARNEVTRSQLKARQDAEPILQMYLAHQEQARSYRENLVPKAERAYQLYLDRYRSMAAAYPQVLVSQRTMFQLRVAQIQLLRDLWSESIALQNYNLSDGLGEPAPSPSSAAGLNLPGAGAGGGQ